MKRVTLKKPPAYNPLLGLPNVVQALQTWKPGPRMILPRRSCRKKGGEEIAIKPRRNYRPKGNQEC